MISKKITIILGIIIILSPHMFKISILQERIWIARNRLTVALHCHTERPFVGLAYLRDNLFQLPRQFRVLVILSEIEFFLYYRDIDNVHVIMVNITAELVWQIWISLVGVHHSRDNIVVGRHIKIGDNSKLYFP